MGIVRIILATVAMLALAAVIYTGTWHLFTLFVWQHPMLSWIPLLAMIAAGLLFGTLRSAKPPAEKPDAPSEALDESERSGRTLEEVTRTPRRRIAFSFWPGLLVGLLVLVDGLYFTVLDPPTPPLEEVEYELVESLPQRSQPRLLPRSAVDDDPAFAQAAEIHLVRDPRSGALQWTGEWQASWLNGPSAGVVVKTLDDLVAQSQVIQGAGFDHSVSGIAPDTMKWEAKAAHPFSRIQYPIVIPRRGGESIALAPYVGYEGFPFRTPYAKGVLVFHQDGTLEDLTPEEAASRPELLRAGRLFPESVARAQAEALAESEEFEGEIVDGHGNRQPFLTAIDDERTVWVTIINAPGRAAGVRAVVLADSSTGETQVWSPPEGEALISTREVIDHARALPLRWEEERCCDSDGHSYTVTLREVVEPRLAFREGQPYYLVTVVPTDELALAREVEYTLLIDGRTGEKLDQFEHLRGPSEDARLQRFFR